MVGTGQQNDDSTSERHVVVASAHRVGSTWLTRILKHYYDCDPDPLEPGQRLHRRVANIADLESRELARSLASARAIQVLKTHCPPPAPRSPIWNLADTLYIYRDPRDMAVSNAYYLANLEPELGGWAEMRALDIRARIRLYLNEAQYDLDLIEQWSRCAAVTRIRYEDLLGDTAGTVARCLRSCGRIVFADRLREAVSHFSFERMSGGRRRGQQAEESFYRKGVAGDWRNFFDASLEDHFRRSCYGRWNDALIQLGYESGRDW